MMLFYASFMDIVYAKLGQASAGDNKVKINDEASTGVGSNQQPSDQKSSKLPLDYCAR